MYIYLNSRLVQNHIQYVENEKKKLNYLIDWAFDCKSMCLDVEKKRIYDEIYDDLVKLRKRIECRIEILEYILKEMKDDFDFVDERLDRITHILKSIEEQ